MVTDFVIRLMRPKNLLKKEDRICALTQLANRNMIPLLLQSVLLSNKCKNTVLRLKNQ